MNEPDLPERPQGPMPSFHDGWFSGMNLVGDRVLELKLRTVSGDDYEIQIPQLERLNVQDFREGNIIGDVAVYKGESIPSAMILQAYAFNGKEPAGYREKAIEQAHHSDWTLLSIDSSYGCQLWALSSCLPGAIQCAKIERRD